MTEDLTEFANGDLTDWTARSDPQWRSESEGGISTGSLFKHHAREHRRQSSLSRYEFREMRKNMGVMSRRRSVVSTSVLEISNDCPKRSRSASMFEFEDTKPMRRKSSTSKVLGKSKGNKETNISEFEGLPKLLSVQGEDRDSLSEIDVDAFQITQELLPSDHERPDIEMKEKEEKKMSGIIDITWRLYWKYFKEGLPVHRILILAVSFTLAQGTLIPLLN